MLVSQVLFFYSQRHRDMAEVMGTNALGCSEYAAANPKHLK
ncbi:MAG: hypothetical protein Kow0083_13530 [Methylophaga sp.]